MTETWNTLNPIDRLGYLTVNLTRGSGEKSPRSIHRLVLEAFVGPCPQGMVCCHNDGDPTNNSLINLRWDTQKGNTEDARRHGTLCRGENARHAKLREEDILEIRRSRAEGARTGDLAKRFDVSPRNVRAIVQGRTWRHILPYGDARPLDSNPIWMQGDSA